MSGQRIPDSIPNENCAQIAAEILKEDLKINIQATDISLAHRLGKKKPSQVDRRSIIVKLCRRD